MMKKQNTVILAMYNNIIHMFLKLDDLSNAQKYSAEMLQMYVNNANIEAQADMCYRGFKPNVFYFTIMIQYFAEKDGACIEHLLMTRLTPRNRFGRHCGLVQRDAEQRH